LRARLCSPEIPEPELDRMGVQIDLIAEGIAAVSAPVAFDQAKRRGQAPVAGAVVMDSALESRLLGVREAVPERASETHEHLGVLVPRGADP